MEAVSVAQQIEKLIEAIRVEGARSTELIEAKAAAMRDYDKELGVAVAALKAAGTAVSIIDRRAKEKAADLLYEKIVAEETLKAHFKRLEYLAAQLNGYQSINRHLEKTQL